MAIAAATLTFSHLSAWTPEGLDGALPGLLANIAYFRRISVSLRIAKMRENDTK